MANKHQVHEYGKFINRHFYNGGTCPRYSYGLEKVCLQ